MTDRIEQIREIIDLFGLEAGQPINGSQELAQQIDALYNQPVANLEDLLLTVDDCLRIYEQDGIIGLVEKVKVAERTKVMEQIFEKFGGTIADLKLYEWDEFDPANLIKDVQQLLFAWDELKQGKPPEREFSINDIKMPGTGDLLKPPSASDSPSLNELLLTDEEIPYGTDVHLDHGIYDGLYRKKFLEGAKAQLASPKLLAYIERVKANERAKVLEEIEENSLPVTLTISKDGKTYGNSPAGKPHRLIVADDWEKLKQGKPLDEEVKG